MLHTNALIHEDSPYLLQHAHNPVDWMPWTTNTLEKAKKENKLIFLSIGYSTCHWCHVMERESFEDERCAKALNASYVSIKVDREEMPDVDKYYQDVHYLLAKRSGGWPLSIIMTPTQQVIFAGTYLPPQSMQGRMGFYELIQLVSTKFKEDLQSITKSAQSIEEALAQYEKNYVHRKSIDKEQLTEDFITKVTQSYDDTHKGIGNAPKFPHASTWNAMLDIYTHKHSLEALYKSEDALRAMGEGGINDQIEGGFYRYSVDEAWVIPHFEKMLYTNAELIEVYAKLFKITQKIYFQEVVEKTIEAMEERFLKNGLFWSASDADSEKEEGKYFVFSYSEVYEVLVKEGFLKTQAQEILDYFGMSIFGNFEHQKNNPIITKKDKPEQLERAIGILKTLRQKISYPFIDTKVLTSWNALMVTALFEASSVKKAQELLDTLLKTLHVNGMLYHQIVFGSSLKVEGLLEDYAFVIEALLRAYEVTGKEEYLKTALRLNSEAKETFFIDNVWYLSNRTFRAKAVLEDNSYKSPLATMLKNRFEISVLSDDVEMREETKAMLESFGESVQKYPHAYPEAVRTILRYM